MRIRAQVPPAVLLPVLLTFLSPLHSATFTPHTVATGLKGGYQVIPADLNHDGKIDLIALASGMTDLIWYENPTWQPHIIASNLPHMINLAIWDNQIVIAYEFANEAKKSVGIVALLKPTADPRQPWTLTEIDRLTTSHRLRWANIHGTGKKVLINAPLTGPDAEAPNYTGHTPIVYYDPADWKRHVISDANEGVQHGIFITDWDATGRDSILTASFSGIHLLQLTGATWKRTEISKGSPNPAPKSGSSDVAVGKWNNTRFLAAIEPWHGNQVVVYTPSESQWDRTVIDDTLVDGHTIVTGDFDGTGRDQIVAGFRGGTHSVYLYSQGATKTWQKSVLDDGGMGAAACAVADLNGDGRPDIACIGSATANLKWYENGK